ncbi:MAG: GPW/gp25 family protein [Acidobacteriota bacterium]
MSTHAYLGRGWNYPLAPNGAGRMAYAAGPDKVAQSIWIILDTDPGERVMRPIFGCGLRRYLMAPNTSATRALIKHDVDVALANFEPRIAVTDLQVTPGDDPALVLIRLAYVTVRDNRPGNLVYPFYLE